jgi:SAM-dependent methyltransferase
MASAPSYHLDPVMAAHKRRVHRELLDEWCDDLEGARILKTDLFEEALGEDQVALDWPDPARGAALFGSDLSHEIAVRSRRRAAERGRALPVSVGDARMLSFGEGTFRYVFSPSTLDHFDHREDLLRGVREAIRVLEPGGILVLTLDNPRTFFYPVVRLLGGCGLFGFRLGATVKDGELRPLLERWGVEVLDCRAVYHVHRLVYTAALKAIRLLGLSGTAASLAGRFRKLERRQGRRGQFRSGWYTAWKLRKPGGPRREGDG